MSIIEKIEIASNVKIAKLSIESSLINSIKMQINQLIKRFAPSIAEKI
ncbi:hypothetical protein FB1_24630 [Flavobacterium branchiophilum NBRC 15030 = ATCC 35035]|uniref:Uncharacterized protein n=1 Tax=Flavobacterium branchiophilum TaxID=55197 RepID=A0A543G6Q5_9FLAO|nr:hypothetical protein BC670_2760 [Flavobacterium branchiophilum]GEM56242.1 hypothetical protein FB1_24630 [Flavobacterium branchiophilum NBRC 15030 = ATCC 35035]